MTAINPISMTSTPIKSMTYDQMPPPDSSTTTSSISQHSNTIDSTLFNHKTNSNLPNLKPFIAMAPQPSPNKPNFNHQVTIAAKPTSTSSTPVPLLAKPANIKPNNTTKQPKNTNCNKVSVQSQQQQLLLQQQQFQQQIQQFQQLQQQKAIYLNGNLNLNTLFAKNNQQQQQQQQLLIAEALKQQKNQTIAPNSQIQLSNQQLYQLLANNNGNSNQTANKTPVMYNQQQSLNKIPINTAPVLNSNNQLLSALKDQQKLASTSSVPQSATIIQATTTSDGQVIFQTVPASTAAAAIAAMQQSNGSSNGLMQQNAQIYLNQLIQQQQQQQQQQYNHQPNPAIAPKITDSSIINQRFEQLQQEQLKQKLLMEEKRHMLLQSQLEQQKHSKQAAISPRPSDLNQTVNQTSNKNKSPNGNESFQNNKSPQIDSIKSERRSPCPNQDRSHSDEIDLTSEMETNDNENSLNQEKVVTSNTETVNHQSLKNPNDKIVKPNQTNSKRRGRPRLYAVNPMTGKSMKGRLISSSPNSLCNPKPCKSPKLCPNQNSNLYNQILINPNTSLIPIQLQSNGITIYTNNPMNNQTNPLVFQNDLNSLSEATTTNDCREDDEQNNTENDQDNSMNESNEEHEQHEQLESEYKEEPQHQETNNNQIDCINNNNQNKLSPVSEISNTISQIKPYRLSPKTMKSQVTLTHIIDGFVIRESSKPFPVKQVKTDLYVDQSNLLDLNQTIEQETEEQSEPINQFKCLECGSDNNFEVIDNKFCSNNCLTSNRIKQDENNETNKSPIKQKHKHKNSLDKLENSSPKKAVIQPLAQPVAQPPAQPLFNISNNLNFTNIEQQYPPGDPTEWNCDDVFQFVKVVSGIHVAELFKAQEVDGSALSLIRDDHLVNTMQIKLGPALKIMSRFNELRSKFSVNKQNF